MDKVKEMVKTMADKGDEDTQSQKRADALKDEMRLMKQKVRQAKNSKRTMERVLARKLRQCERGVQRENIRETRRRQRQRNAGPQPPLPDPASTCDVSLDADLSSLSTNARASVQPVLDAKTAIQRKDDDLKKADQEANNLKEEYREVLKAMRKMDAAKEKDEKTLKDLVKECERTFRKENDKIERKTSQGKKSAYAVHDSAVMCAAPSSATKVAILAALGARASSLSLLSSSAALAAAAFVAAAAAFVAAATHTRLLARRRRLASVDERTKLIV